MKKLALYGHSTRGDEVIAILRMLGGVNSTIIPFNGMSDDLYYYIGKDNSIIGSHLSFEGMKGEYVAYTLEDYIDAFPFKIGDRVIEKNGRNGVICNMVWNEMMETVAYSYREHGTNEIRSNYLQNNLKPKFTNNATSVERGHYIRIGEIPADGKSKVHNGDAIIGEEKGVSVYNCVLNNKGKYQIVMPTPFKEGQGLSYEGLANNVSECRYKVNVTDKVYLVTGDEVGIGSDNEPVLENVAIIKDITNDFVKVKKYPKTYSEACLVLGIDSNIFENDSCGDYSKVIDYGKLLVCRDAWWKIDGNWKPVFGNGAENNCIYTFNNEPFCTMVAHRNTVLCFSSEKLCNDFLETFKEEIEKCKEFL